MEEPIDIEHAAESPGRWSEYQHAAGIMANAMATRGKELFVYTHRLRCPSCHGYWVFQTASPVGTIVKSPNPVRIGMGLLCGSCEGKRMAIMVIPPRDGVKGATGKFWSQQDTDHAMMTLRGNPNSYAVQITKSEKPWDGVTGLVDDKQSYLDLLFKKKNGVRSVAISQQFHAQHLPDWCFAIETPDVKS